MTVLLLCSRLFVLLAGYALQWRNMRHLKASRSIVPSGFEAAIDASTLERACTYSLEKSRASRVQSVFDNAVFLLFLFGGGLGIYDRWVSASFGPGPWSGVCFFLGLSLASTVLGIPFDLYDTFRLEARHGFNVTSGRLWLSDFVKSTVLSTVLVGLLSYASLGLTRWAATTWWIWVWALFVVVSVFLLFLSPYVIEPLFFKFQPVVKAGLEDGIRELMASAGLQVDRVFQVDASRRSRHSNAYFTGLGRVKRVVLFDTLLDQMEPKEILAVLAHEIGHWKRRHVLKRLCLSAAMALMALYAAFRLVQWGSLPRLVGLSGASLPAQTLILWVMATTIGFLLTPALSSLSRRNEIEADCFASELTRDPEALSSALVKLSVENLANLHPDPLYAWMYYSHPPVVERVKRLRAFLDAPTTATERKAG